MATTPHNRPSTFLLFPWGLFSIALVFILSFTLNDGWYRANWSWIMLVLIIPAAIFENFKVGYSTMRIMFMKVVSSLLSFLLVGVAFGVALVAHFKDIPEIKKFELPWFVSACFSRDAADPGSTAIQYAEGCKKRVYADGS